MKLELDVPDDIIAFMESDQMTSSEFFESVWAICRGVHGKNQLRGTRRENFTSKRLSAWCNVLEYRRGDEGKGACDHLIRHVRLPDFWIRIEEKTASWKLYKPAHLMRVYPQGNVTFNLYRARLSYDDPNKYYLRHDNEKFKAFHIATGTYVKDGVCHSIATRVSQIAEHPKHPGRLYNSVNVVLDAPGEWADLFETIEAFVDERLQIEFRNRAYSWFTKS